MSTRTCSTVQSTRGARPRRSRRDSHRSSFGDSTAYRLVARIPGRAMGEDPRMRARAFVDNDSLDRPASALSVVLCSALGDLTASQAHDLVRTEPAPIG